MSEERVEKREKVPVVVGQLREDPDGRYAYSEFHEKYGGKKRVVEVTFLGADGKASVKDTVTGRPSKVKTSTLERWRVVP